MILLYKQLTKELLKNKISIFLLFMLTFFTSCMFFFVQFSIDENMSILSSYSVLNENQLLYQTGLTSNNLLARNGLAAFTLLTGLVFFIFLHYFIKKEKKQLGCLKALGFKNSILCGYFVSYTAILSLLGSIAGLCVGYFISDILLNANARTYLIPDVKKGIYTHNVLIGLFLPIFLYCLIAIASYSFIRGKEIACLTTIDDKPMYTTLLRGANNIAQICPVKNKLSLRLALRKPISVLFVVLSVMIFSVMFILAFSLNKSSQIVFDSQTMGHDYLFDTLFESPRNWNNNISNASPYLRADAVIKKDNITIEQTIIGMDKQNDIFSLLDNKKNKIEPPAQNQVVIGTALQELYQIKTGDTITIAIKENEYNMVVSDVAFNAKTNCLYLSNKEFSKMLSLPENSYNGLWSMENLFPDASVISNTQKVETLKRDSVSNQVSAVINHVIGCFVGVFLLLLALLLNFQDSKRDILILHLMGYQPKKVRSMLIDIYQPLLLVSFIITLYPAIQIVRGILKSLSLQIGDYMPFETNIFIILLIFVLLYLMYYGVQSFFHFGIQKIIKKENITDYAM